MKRSTKKIKEVNIKLTKEEFKQLGRTRDGALITSIVWTLMVYWLVNLSGINTHPVKIIVCYIVLVGFWGFTLFLNYLMIKVKKYMRSLFIRPSLEDEEENNIHIIK